MAGAARPIHLLLSCLLLAFAPLLWANDEQATRQKLSELNAEMQQLQSLTKRFKADRSELQQALSKTEKAIGKINRQIRSTSQQLKTQQDQLRTLQAKRSQLKQQRSEQQSLIEQQIRAAYQLGQQNKLKVMLNQERPEELSRMLAYYDYFNKARSQEIERYIGIIADIDAIEPEISNTAEALKSSQQQLSQQRQKLEAEQGKRKQNIANINASLKTHTQQLKQITSDRKRLQELLDTMQEAVANLTIPNDKPFRARKGKLPWPVKGRLQQRFGKKRSSGKLRWEGVILGAKEGADVKAIHHGRVLFADWFRGSGLLIILDHGDGYMSLYAHNQSLLIEPGEWVNAGDSIATVGNSGGRKRAGLYFEIRHDGEPTNPQRWCKRT